MGRAKSTATVIVDEVAQAEIERRKVQREGRIIRLAKNQLLKASQVEVEKSPKDARWYCLQVKHNSEFTVEKRLLDAGVEALLPCEKVVSVKCGKKVEGIRAFFPGYLLVRIVPTPEAFAGLRMQKRVAGIVGNSTGYHVIRDDQVAVFQASSVLDVSRMPVDKTIGQGSKCRIKAGSLAGFECVVLQVRSTREPRAKIRICVAGNFMNADRVPVAFLEKL